MTTRGSNDKAARPAGGAISIPVAVDTLRRDDGLLDATTLAVLNELEAMLEVLASSGAGNSVDLRRSPLAQHEYQQLKTTLGEGEVSADIDSCGRTRVYETAVPGIWWVTHYNQDEKAVGEFIEVTAYPEILRSQPEDLRTAAGRLRERVSRRSQRAPDPEDIVRSLKVLGLDESTIMKNPKLNPVITRGAGNVE